MMEALRDVIPVLQPTVERLGWTLLHSFWQGTLVAMLLGILLFMLRRQSANLRYAVSCAALLVAAAVPVLTFFLIEAPAVSRADGSNPTGGGRMGLPAEFAVSAIIPASPSSGAAGIDEGRNFALDAADDTLAQREDAPVLTGTGVSAASPATTGNGITAALRNMLRPVLPWLAAAWMFGVLVLSIRLFATWRRVQQFRIMACQPVNAGLANRLDQLARQMGIERTIALFESALIEVPTVLGWFRPVVLLPIAVANGLTVDQLEAILAHELAHIRRADYAVNLVQSVIETLLFYHPGVWWISGRIRQEREHCCDDLAAEVSRDKAEYARALLKMEELRGLPQTVAVAAGGGNLVERVRRLLTPPAPDRLSPWWPGSVVSLLVVAALIGFPFLRVPAANSLLAATDSSHAVEDQEKAGGEPASNNRHETDIESGSTLPNNADDNPDATPPTRLTDQASGADFVDSLTPAQIADRIEEEAKKYKSIEYSGSMELTRNTAFGREPVLVSGTGRFLYRRDGEKWYVEENTFSFASGTTETYPQTSRSAFDGQVHYDLDRRGLELACESTNRFRLQPEDLFWKAGVTRNWLLSALRRPEAKIVGEIAMAETTCLNIVVEWKPDWDDKDRRFDIMLCPRQGWLPRRVLIDRGGEMEAEWKIGDVAQTDSGLWYPVIFTNKRPDWDSTPLSKIRIERLRESPKFGETDFTVPATWGIDITDHRLGFAWHNDPWWNDLAPWLRESMTWPRPDTGPLRDLKSYSDQAIGGTVAPQPDVAEWVQNPESEPPMFGNGTVTVLFFFGGSTINPSAGQLKALDILQQRYGDGGVSVVAITPHDQSPDQVKRVVQELGLSYPVAIDKPTDGSISPDTVRGVIWGQTFAAFQQQTYTGTMVIGADGTIHLIDPGSSTSFNQPSAVESIVREQLQKNNGTSDPPGLRRELVTRFSQLLRGTSVTDAEVTAAVADTTETWFANAQRQMIGSLTEEQTEWLTNHRLTAEAVESEFNNAPDDLQRATLGRIDDEWKRRVANAPKTCILTGTVSELQAVTTTQAADAGGNPNNEPTTDDDSAKRRLAATITIRPQLRLLSGNILGSTTLLNDRQRQQTVKSDSSGRFGIPNLIKGTYVVGVSADGYAQRDFTIHFADSQRRITLDVELPSGNVIRGSIKSSDGKPVVGARVQAVKRYTIPDRPKVYTTEHVPRTPLTTNPNGEFTFTNLHDGRYEFEVTAEGFEPATIAPVAPGSDDIRLVLQPVPQVQLPKPATRVISGNVIDEQGEPIINAEVGLQMWKRTDDSRYANGNAFAATATTDVAGIYRLVVPDTLDDRLTVAVWAVADGYTPTRDNHVRWLGGILKNAPSVKLATCSGSDIRVQLPSGEPAANVSVFVRTQRMPRSVAYPIPKDWWPRVSGTTDENGQVALPNVIPASIAEVLITLPDRDGIVRLDQNFFLNERPAETEGQPHFSWTLPTTGSLAGRIVVDGGTLPADLSLDISTESSMPNAPRVGIHGSVSATVNSDGTFRVASLATGRVFIKPFLAENQPLRSAVPRGVIINAAEQTQLTIPVKKGVLVRGQVRQSDTGNGHPDVGFKLLYGQSAREKEDMNNSFEITTDAGGRFEAWVPPGPIILRLSWNDNKYADTEWWSDRIDQWGSRFEIPDGVESFDLEPIELVPSGFVTGKVVDTKGKPLHGWTVYGYPDIPGKPRDEFRMNCVGGTRIGEKGEFNGRFPSTYPPAFWQVSHRDWPTPYEFDDDKWDAEIVSQDPLVLQVNRTASPKTTD